MTYYREATGMRKCPHGAHRNHLIQWLLGRLHRLHLVRYFVWHQEGDGGRMHICCVKWWWQR